jgi:hypothetical protein
MRGCGGWLVRPGLMRGAGGAWVAVEGSVSMYRGGPGCMCAENVVELLFSLACR